MQKEECRLQNGEADKKGVDILTSKAQMLRNAESRMMVGGVGGEVVRIAHEGMREPLHLGGAHDDGAVAMNRRRGRPKEVFVEDQSC
jgi:hypothetical protein